MVPHFKEFADERTPAYSLTAGAVHSLHGKAPFGVMMNLDDASSSTRHAGAHLLIFPIRPSAEEVSFRCFRINPMIMNGSGQTGELSHVARVTLHLPSGSVSIGVARPIFKRWNGLRPTLPKTYANKPLIDFDGKWCFAEIAILRLVAGEGYSGVWNDLFHKRFWDENNISVDLAATHRARLREIAEGAKAKSGAWDIICWSQESTYRFLESKQRKCDTFKPAQGLWLDSALRLGMSAEMFTLVEWSFAGDSICDG
jgi:hypothetical protein